MKTCQKESRICKTCRGTFLYGGRNYRKLYCSTACFKKGVKTPWNKGLKGFRAGEKRPGVMSKGDKNGSWKGDKVCYRGLHMWVELVLGKPDTCVYCDKKGTGHNMHWANISGQYLREITDWIRLCPKCHKAFDKETRIYKQNKKTGL